MRKDNIATSVHFIPLHLHPYYRDTFGYKPEDFPHALAAYQGAISLPLYPRMSEADVWDVIRAVRRIVERAPGAEAGMIKRSFDAILAAVGLVLVAPVLAVIAILIKLDSTGPVFFRQERIGKDGRPFRIFKFRTMVDNAYNLGPRLTQKRDPRVTRVGLILRWTKLDELPQLLNVVAGDMSFVGPRPEDPHFVRLYTPAQREVLRVRPGVVGPSQILGRDELELYPEGVDTEQYYIHHILPQKLQTDLEYVRRARLWYDLKLLGPRAGRDNPRIDQAQVLPVQRRAHLVPGPRHRAEPPDLLDGLRPQVRLDPEARTRSPYLVTASALIVLIRPFCFVYFGLYQNILRYLGTSEFVAVLKAVTLGSVLIAASLFLLDFDLHSRAVLVIDWMLLVVALYGYRLYLKLRAENRSHARIPALIVGANDTGEQLAGQLLRDPALPYSPVGFLDDDLSKQGALIHGIKVLGTIQDLPHVARLKGARMVLIPHPTEPTNGEVREAVERCRQARLEYRVLPALDHLLNGTELAPEVTAAAPDLTSRSNGMESNGALGAPAETAPAAITRGQAVLVTGGAGYVGSWLVRKLLDRQLPGPRARQLPLRRPGARRDRRSSAPGDHRGRHSPPRHRGPGRQGRGRGDRPRRARGRRGLRPGPRGDRGHQLRVGAAARRRLPAAGRAPLRLRLVVQRVRRQLGPRAQRGVVAQPGVPVRPDAHPVRGDAPEALGRPGGGHPPPGHGVRALAADALRPDRQHPHHARRPQGGHAGVRGQPVAPEPARPGRRRRLHPRPGGPGREGRSRASSTSAPTTTTTPSSTSPSWCAATCRRRRWRSRGTSPIRATTACRSTRSAACSAGSRASPSRTGSARSPRPSRTGRVRDPLADVYHNYRHLKLHARPPRSERAAVAPAGVAIIPSRA